MGIYKHENTFEDECNFMQDLGFSLSEESHWLRWVSNDKFTLEEQDKIETLLNDLRNGYECEIEFTKEKS